MAAARPAIAIEYGGPAELIDDEVGKALPATGRQAVVQGLIEAFHDIVRHPDQWRARGLEGRRRAESQFGWESKIDQALSVYSRVLSQNNNIVPHNLTYEFYRLYSCSPVHLCGAGQCDARPENAAPGAL